MHNLALVPQVNQIIDNLCYILHILTYKMILMQRMFYFVRQTGCLSMYNEDEF